MDISEVDLAYSSLDFFSQWCFRERFVNSWFHTRWFNSVQDPGVSRALNIAPRNSGKTTCWAKKAPLWLKGRDVDLKILLLSRTGSKARSNLRFIRQNVEGNARVRRVFPGLVPSVPWSDEELTFENNRFDGEPCVIARGLGGSITGFRADVLIVDDLIDKTNVMTETQRGKVNEYWDEIVIPTLNPDGRIFCVGCLTANARVTMVDGSWKYIVDCEVGDRVISYDSVQTVEAVIPQGDADVYRIKTKNHEIEATINHPFLCERDGKKTFVKLEELQVGDYLICSHKNDVSSDSSFSEGDMWFLGYMFGDGWISLQYSKYGSKRFKICFAKSVQQWKNQRMIKYLKNKFNAKIVETDHGYYRTCSHKVGYYLENELNFLSDATAKTKRIPKYVFSLSEPLREAFLNGFSAADGYIDKHNLTRIEISNQELIFDLKQLATGLGYKVSNIYYRKRISQPPHSPKPIEAESYHISYGWTKRHKKYRKIYVQSIEHIGKKPVYDLTVSNTHNFIANGLVVHNTRYHHRDFYARLLESPEYAGNTFVFPAFEVDARGREVLGGDGLPISYWPERWPSEKLLQRKAEITYKEGSLAWSSQYMGDPSGYEGRLFKSEWLERGYYSVDDDLVPKYGNLDYYMSMDPNISEEPKSDNTAICTIAVDRVHKDIYVLDFYASPLDYLDQVKKLNEYGRRAQLRVGKSYLPGEQRFRKIGIESVAYQKSLQRTGYVMGLPVVEVQHSKMDKTTRLLRLQPHFENMRIKLPDPEIHRTGWWDEFYDEYTTFPRSRRDDLLDSLEVAVEVSGVAGDVSGIPWFTDDSDRRWRGMGWRKPM